MPTYMGTNAIINYILSVKECILMVNHPEVITGQYFTSLILKGLVYLRVLYVSAELSDSCMVLSC